MILLPQKVRLNEKKFSVWHGQWLFFSSGTVMGSSFVFFLFINGKGSFFTKTSFPVGKRYSTMGKRASVNTDNDCGPLRS